MLKRSILACGMLLMVVMLAACGSGDSEDYLTLVESGEDIPEEGDFLLYYYSSDCSYCIKFAPTVKEYTEKEDSLPIYMFDSTIEDSFGVAQEMIEKYELVIEGTPSLVLVRDGVVEDVLVGIQEIENIPVK